MNGIEWALDKVKTSLVTSLPGRLTAINTSYGDDINLPAPQSGSYYIYDQLAIPDMPALVILPDDTDTSIPANTWDEDTHTIIIIAHNVSDWGRVDECAKKSYRYAQAISEVILADRTLSDSVLCWYRTNIDYTPMMSDDNCLKQEVWVTSQVKLIET